MRRWMLAAAVAAFFASDAAAERTTDPLNAVVTAEDVTAFFRIYDAADGEPSAKALAAYIENGSPGLRGFIRGRIVSADNLAMQVAQRPAMYAAAKACARRLGNLQARVRAAFQRLKALYPLATFPETYILIGAGNSGGTANGEALMIGLEVVCRPESPDQAPIHERLTHMIAHEATHSLQRGFMDHSLLSQSLTEGAAEFVSELISGRVLNDHLDRWTRGREGEIERRFARQMGGLELSAWLYNGLGTPERPGDLGYWVGYRIVRAYYARHRDKHRAVFDILQSTNARAFRAASGWRPAAQ